MSCYDKPVSIRGGVAEVVRIVEKGSKEKFREDLDCTLEVLVECRGGLPGDKVVVQNGPVETRRPESGGKGAGAGSDIKPVIRGAVI